MQRPYRWLDVFASLWSGLDHRPWPAELEEKGPLSCPWLDQAWKSSSGPGERAPCQGMPRISNRSQEAFWIWRGLEVEETLQRFVCWVLGLF